MRHKIFDPHIAKAIYAKDPESNDEDVFFSSQPNDEKHTRYLKYIQNISNDRSDGYRHAWIAGEIMIEVLEEQKQLYPNMVAVIERV